MTLTVALLFVAPFSLMFAALVACNYVLLNTQRFFCPADAFMYGPTGFGHMFMLSPWYFIGLTFAMMCAAFVQYRFLTDDEKRYRISHKRLRLVLLWFGVPGIALSVVAIPSSYCVSERGIALRSFAWTAQRNYAWSDIRTITTACVGSRDHFVVGMVDGALVDLHDPADQFVAEYPRLDAMLRNGTFRFSTSNFENCPRRLEPLFGRRPGASKS